MKSDHQSHTRVQICLLALTYGLLMVNKQACKQVQEVSMMIAFEALGLWFYMHVVLPFNYNQGLVPKSVLTADLINFL